MITEGKGVINQLQRDFRNQYIVFDLILPHQ